MVLSPETSVSEIRVETLPHRLKVLLAPRPGVRVATADVWVAVGSGNEPAAISGASHFLEHMLFKGTDRYAAGEIDRIVEGMGGVVNAATSLDFTHFHITAASENLRVALEVLADMVRNARLDPEDLDRERKVILEEYLIKQDSPPGLLWDELFWNAFEKGPYKQSVLGVPETLKATDRSALLDYYHRHYAPENMALVVVGDMNPSEVLEQARAAFADFDRPFAPLLNTQALDTVYANGIETVIEKDVSECYGVMAFPSPPLQDAATGYELDVLQFILGGGDASVLCQEIKEKRRLATSIHASATSSRHPNLFCIFYTCDPGNRAQLEKAVLEEIDRLAQSPPAPAALHRAQKLLANAHTFSLETTGGESGAIGYYYTITGGIEFERHFVPGVHAVTAERIQERVRQWLSARDPVRVVIHPKG